MNLISFEGQMGNGKTLGMSILAKYYQEKTGCTLYSNYGLEGSKPFNSFYDFLDVCMQPSSIVCLDESHNDVDSRDFSSNSVKFFSHIVFYLRKMRCMVMMTSPLFENLDSRIRGVTNVVVSVSKDKDYYYYPFFDYQSNKSLKTIKIKKDNAHSLAESIFDTYAMVTPLEYPSSRDEFKKLLIDIKLKNQAYLERANERSLMASGGSRQGLVS